MEFPSRATKKVERNGETLYHLGRDIYASASSFKERTLVHVRQYIKNPSSNGLLPTKTGIAILPVELDAFTKSMNSLKSDIARLEGQRKRSRDLKLKIPQSDPRKRILKEEELNTQLFGDENVMIIPSTSTTSGTQPKKAKKSIPPPVTEWQERPILSGNRQYLYKNFLIEP